MYKITLNGNLSDLSCNFFPPIEVTRNANICLLSLQTNDSIPNINNKCNQISIVRKNANQLIKDHTSQLDLNKNIEIYLLEEQSNVSNAELTLHRQGYKSQHIRQGRSRVTNVILY